MSKKILFSIFALLSLFVIVLLVILLSNTNNIPNTLTRHKNSSALSSNSKIKNYTWAKKLSDYKQRDFMMPVTDLFISIKFKTNNKKVFKKKKKYFRLIISNLDNYSLFCILQVFENKKIPFVIQKSYNNSKIYMNADKMIDLSSISKELMKYNIKSKIKLVEK